MVCSTIQFTIYTTHTHRKRMNPQNKPNKCNIKQSLKVPMLVQYFLGFVKLSELFRIENFHASKNVWVMCGLSPPKRIGLAIGRRFSLAEPNSKLDSCQSNGTASRDRIIIYKTCPESIRRLFIFQYVLFIDK